MPNKHAILFVDDDENILNSLRRLFRREGYEILLAKSGTEGLEVLKNHQVSLIISDQRMPEMIGAEFLAKAKEISPQSMRIMLTGYSDLDAATQAINQGGISRFITKPWDDDELKMVVRDAIQRIDLEVQNLFLTEQLRHKNAALENFNSQLEKAVSLRTLELHYKIKELEGKDRIAQHMLSVNSLEETLELVLQVIGDIIEMDKSIIYLLDGGQPKPTAAIGIYSPKAIVAQSDLEDIKKTPLHESAFAQVLEQKKPVNIKDTKSKSISPFAVVPILRGDDLLGYIDVSNSDNKDAISSEEVDMVASFALQAAMAISDAQSHKDISSWKVQLEDVLKEIN